MFTHAVLFKINKSELKKYYRDNKMWARHAKKAKGFISYYTMKRADFKDQYASVYSWRDKKYHDKFMGKFHDWLVSKSYAKVKVLGYYNFNSQQHF
ncbi:MAG: hypothetical protein PHI86_02210 [Candidatus Omnitrophica bacterium]|nr:hypothetical protein [Candidatus Omnitrophota bacterium]HOX54088.1 hypothetical protein [Candidatus Omnitrophota bacterium]